MNGMIKRTLKINTSLIFLLVSMFSIISCMDDFLNVKPQGLKTEEVFLKNANEAQLATIAIYNIFLDWNYHCGGYPLLDIMSDDAYKGSSPGDGGFINLFNNFQ